MLLTFDFETESFNKIDLSSDDDFNFLYFVYIGNYIKSFTVMILINKNKHHSMQIVEDNNKFYEQMLTYYLNHQIHYNNINNMNRKIKWDQYNVKIEKYWVDDLDSYLLCEFTLNEL